MTKEQDALESKYRLVVKLACLIALVTIILIDGVIKNYEASVAVELALVGAIGGIEVAEKSKARKRARRRPTRRTRRRG